MGPREFTRGDDGSQGCCRSLLIASMGPREFTRGDLLDDSIKVEDDNALQWGRGSSPAETSSARRRRFALATLQWGRGSSPAETSSSRSSTPTISSFNGAAGVHPRRLAFRPGPTLGTSQLQWGRGSSPAETTARGHRLGRLRRASMGPREFTRGDRSSGRRSGSRERRFNGAAGVHPRRLRHRRDPVPAQLASMGPREFTRGDVGCGTGEPESHGASMGPREFTRGDEHLRLRLEML